MSLYVYPSSGSYPAEVELEVEVKTVCEAAVFHLSHGVAKVGLRGAGSEAVLSKSRFSFEAFNRLACLFAFRYFRRRFLLPSKGRNEGLSRETFPPFEIRVRT